MNQVYKCPMCQKNTMFATKYKNHTEYRCQSCGHSYKVPIQKRQVPSLDIVQLLTKYSWFISVIVLIGFVIMSSFLIVSIGNNSTRIDLVWSELSGDISDNSGDILYINDSLLNLKGDITTINTLLSTMQNDITNLKSLNTDVSKIKNDIIAINIELSSIWNNVSMLNNLTGNDVFKTLAFLNFTFFENQTNVTNYCHLNFSVKNTWTQIGEVQFGFQYDKTNVSLMNWSGNIKPQEYQWTNDIYNDNYYTHWFERGESFYSIYNITWSFSDYNSTQLDTGDIKKNLMVNGFLIGDIEVVV